jgi:hypothetical protein
VTRDWEARLSPKPISTPTSWTEPAACAHVVRGHAAAAPPINVMKKMWLDCPVEETDQRGADDTHD